MANGQATRNRSISSLTNGFNLLGELTRMGFVQQIVALLQTEHCPFHEHIMAALLQLITENPRAQVVATRPELHLLSFLKTRMEELKGKPAFEVSSQRSGL